MTRTKINYKPLIVIFISILTLAVTIFCLRQWNRTHRAGLGLRDGIEAFENKQWESAAENLGKYIAIVPDDVSALMKYADAQINIFPMNINTINQAINSYRRVLRIDPVHKFAVLKLMDIYMQLLDSPAEAELISTGFLKHREDSKVRQTLAMSYYMQRKFTEANRELMRVIEDDSSVATAYALLARIAENRPEESAVTPQEHYDKGIANCPENPLAYIVRGEYYLRQSSKSKAIDDFNKAETLSLSDVSVRLRLAEAFYDTAMLKKARRHLDRATAYDPDNIQIWQMWAKLALFKNSPEEMSSVARRACESLSSDRIVFLPVAAELFIRGSDFTNALNAIAEFKQLDDSTGKVAYLQGLMSKKQGYTLKAIEFWRRAVKSGFNSDQVVLSMASALAELGDIDSAILQLRNYTMRERYLLRADLMLAEYLAQIGKYTQALGMATKYLKSFPESIKGKLMVSSLQSQMGSLNDEKPTIVDWDKLQQQLLNPIQNTPPSLSEMIAAVGVSIGNKKTDFARQLIDRLKEQYPSNQDVMLAEVEVLIAENNRETAKTKLLKITEMSPNSVKVMRYLTAFYVQENNWEACEDVLSNIKLSAISSDDARAIKMLLAEVYERSKQFDKAWAVLKSIHRINPSDITINRWLIAIAGSAEMTDECQSLVDKIKDAEGPQGWQWRYEQAKLWFNSDDFEKHYEQIITNLTENLKINSEDQSSRLLVAATYEKIGNIQLASSAYKQALLYSPDDIEITLAAVAVMYKSGEYDLAEQTIRNAQSGGMNDNRLSRLELNTHIRKRNYSSASSILRKLSADDPQNNELKLSLVLLNIRDKKFDEAAVTLDKLKQQDPDSIAVTAAIIELNLKLNNTDQAIVECNELVENNSNAKTYTLRGRTYMRIGDLSNAAHDFQTALHMDPEAVPTMLYLARTYQSRGQLGKAMQLITMAVEKAPDNFDVQKTAALIFLSSKDPDVAKKTTEAMESALRINSDDVEMLMLKARILFAKRTKPAYSKAINILQKATRIDPMYPQAWAISAEIYLARKDYSLAMDNIISGLVYLPESKLLYLSKARIEATRSPQLAVKTLGLLREKYPNDTDVAVYLAYMYINAGQSSAAVKLLRSLGVDSGSSDYQKIETALAEALFAEGKTDESMKKVLSLYKSYPNSQTPLLAHVRILKSHKKWGELSEVVLQWYRDHDKNSKLVMAIIQKVLDYKIPASVDCTELILRGIIEDDYENIDALNSLGVLMHVTGRSAEALRYYEKVLMLDPDRVVAINNMAWILCEEQSKFDQALKLTSTGLTIYPDYADLLDTAGVTRYRMGQYEKSISEFKRCIQLRDTGESGTAGVHFHIARSLEKLSRFTEAIHHLEKAIEINKLNGGLSSGELAEVNMLLSEISERN